MHDQVAALSRRLNAINLRTIHFAHSIQPYTLVIEYERIERLQRFQMGLAMTLLRLYGHASCRRYHSNDAQWPDVRRYDLKTWLARGTCKLLAALVFEAQ